MWLKNNVMLFKKPSIAYFLSKLCLWCLLSLLGCADRVFAQAGGQDNWQWTGKSLAVPNTASRKCIAISNSGIYVGTLNASSKCTTVEQYTLSGAYTKTWTTAFTDIHGLACDNAGSVYAYDMGASKVRVFSGQGDVTGSWGSTGTGSGQFSLSTGTVMVHAIAVDESKNVYVADRGNSRIQVFDSAGNFKFEFGSAGDLPGQFQGGPAAVACSPDGFVLAYDAPSNWYHISQFSPSGKYFKRTAQNPNITLTYTETNVARSDYGYGGDRAFAISPDGLLLVGAEQGNNSFSASTVGQSRIFQVNNISSYGTAVFPSSSTYLTTRGGAFDPSGNIWAVRDKIVECLERRMRFDVYRPAKPLPQPVIVKISQQSGSTLVDVDFQVNAPGTATVETAMAAFQGGTRSFDKLVIPKTFSGSTAGVLGANVPAGTKLRASWDAGTDLAGQNFASLAFELLAKDDRNLLGVHYAVIPSDATNPLALKISNKPIADNDLWDMFLWLLVQGDSRLSITGTKIMLTAAGQTYVSGAPPLLSGTSVANTVYNGSVFTTQGRQFAYKYLNCRAVTAAEKARVQAGNFGVSSVTDNSVVSLDP